MSEYEAPDIDVTTAQRRANVGVGSFVAFEAIRSLPGSASGAFSYGVHASRPASGAVGDQYLSTDRGWVYYFTGTAWVYLTGVNVGTNATRAAITVTANDNGSLFFTTDQNKLWRVEAGAWVDKSTTLDVTTSVKVAGTKVIGTQGAVVADPTGGATVDTECRAQLALLLARVRTHGLIQT